MYWFFEGNNRIYRVAILVSNDPVAHPKNPHINRNIGTEPANGSSPFPMAIVAVHMNRSR